MTHLRTAAATRARVTGGRDDGMLHLLTRYREGATILAGTRVPPADPVQPRPRLGVDCSEPGCCTTVFADTRIEAVDRLAAHRRSCHG